MVTNQSLQAYVTQQCKKMAISLLATRGMAFEPHYLLPLGWGWFTNQSPFGPTETVGGRMRKVSLVY